MIDLIELISKMQKWIFKTPNSSQIKGVTVKGIKGVTVKVIKGVTVKGIKGVTVKRIKGVTVKGIKDVTVKGIKGVTVKELKVFFPTNVNELCHKLRLSYSYIFVTARSWTLDISNYEFC